MGKELDVLVPLDRVGLVEPLEVQLAVVERHVRADEVGSDIGHESRGEVPVHVVLLVRALQAAQNGRIGTVFGGDVEASVGFGDGPALVDEGVGHLLEFGKRRCGDELVDAEVAVLEVVLPLLLREHPWRVRQNLVGRHDRPSSNAAARAAASSAFMP